MATCSTQIVVVFSHLLLVNNCTNPITVRAPLSRLPMGPPTRVPSSQIASEAAKSAVTGADGQRLRRALRGMRRNSRALTLQPSQLGKVCQDYGYHLQRSLALDGALSVGSWAMRCAPAKERSAVSWYGVCGCRQLT
jgi:hypothetical protein